MNKEHIQSKPHAKNIVFSSCGLFAVNSTVGLLGQKNLLSLLSTVILPYFGPVYQFSPYPIPYEWLSDDRTPDTDAEGQARDRRSTSVSHYNQHNTIRIFGPSVLYRWLVNKHIWHVSEKYARSKDSYRFASDRSLQASAGKANDLVTRAAVEDRQDKGLISGLNGLITFDPNKKAGKKPTAGLVDGLFRKVNVKAPKGSVQLHRKLLGNTATATTAHPIGANTSYANTAHANTKSMDQANLSTVLQQASIQRTIKTLAIKNAEEQREHKALFELLQQQLKQAEQLSNQDMSRLQQSVQELKTMLSAQQQSVSFSSPRPPSFYGRFK